MESAAKSAGTKEKVGIFLQTIKFEHTLFALPFAYLGLWLGEGGWPRWNLFFWVTLAMAGMRTTAMSVNRLVDLEIDKINPRTQSWPLSQGRLSAGVVLGAAFLSAAVYFAAAWKLNSLCLLLSPIPLIMVMIYPYLKRFTWFCHFFLGMILGLAPAAGWIASRGSLSMECWLLFTAVTFWVAGFDIIYALQDIDFDRSYGLQSFPAVFGSPAALWLVRALHAATVLVLTVLGVEAGLGFFYAMGLALIALFLLRENWLIAKSGLAKIQTAFFQMNVWVSTVLFIATCIDLVLR